jgi:hypothetical protein
LTTKTNRQGNRQEDSQESYGRYKVLTTFLAKVNKRRHHQQTWPRYLKIQRNCRHSLMRPSLQQSRQRLLLFLLLLRQQELWRECLQCQPNSQSILLELAILHTTSRLARD